MDPKFKVDDSSTAEFVQCASPPKTFNCRRCSDFADGRCHYSQSYAEGSSIRGVLVSDVTWIGSDTSAMDLEDALGIRFHFGCHTSETSALWCVGWCGVAEVERPCAT